MNQVFAFCALFLIIPVGLNAIRRVFSILYGPESESAYHQQVYRDTVRKGVIEIVISFVGLGVALIALYYGSRLWSSTP